MCLYQTSFWPLLLLGCFNILCWFSLLCFKSHWGPTLLQQVIFQVHRGRNFPVESAAEPSGTCCRSPDGLPGLHCLAESLAASPVFCMESRQRGPPPFSTFPWCSLFPFVYLAPSLCPFQASFLTKKLNIGGKRVNLAIWVSVTSRAKPGCCGVYANRAGHVTWSGELANSLWSDMVWQN